VLVVGEPGAALARLRGDLITVEPAVSNVGEAETGVERMFRVELTNRTDRPIRIIGGTDNCSCIATDSLPLTLFRDQPQSIEVWVRFRGSAGRFQHRFVLLTDDARQPVVVARFTGRVLAPPE
jgi:hypothetical protein